MKVLIAEDDDVLREILVFVLETELGAKVFEAATGKAAIEVVRSHPDLSVIVCDYRMPDGTGGDVFRFVRSQGSKVPFILCSGDTGPEHPDFQGQTLAGFLL